MAPTYRVMMSINWRAFDLFDGAPKPTDVPARGRYAFVTNRPPLPDRPSGFSIRYRDVVAEMIGRGSTSLVLLVSSGSEPAVSELVDALAEEHPGLTSISIGEVDEGRAPGAYRFLADAIGPRGRSRPPGIDHGAVVVAAHLQSAPLVFEVGRTGAFLLEEDFGRHDAPPTGAFGRFGVVLRRWKDERILDRIDASGRRVIVLTEDERNRFAARIDPTAIEVVPLWVDAEALAPTHDGLGAGGSGTGSPAPTIGWVGRLGDERWVDPGLEILRLGLRTRPWRWKLIGASPHARLIELAERHPDRIELTGRVPSVTPHYRDLDAAIVPATPVTGTKTTLLQAWAAGVPVVASEDAARSAGALDGSDALVYRTPGGAIDSIDLLIDDPSLHSSLVAAGSQRIEGLDAGRLARRILDIAEQSPDEVSS